MILIFPGRIGPVVATEAIAIDIRVIEVGRYPCHRCMSIIAIVATAEMCRVLADRDGAVMTR